MPYYIFLIKPFAMPEKLEEHASFSSASKQAKLLRAAQPPTTTEKIKVMFADTQIQAEDLLCQIRDPAPIGDE